MTIQTLGGSQLPPNCCQYSSPDATSYSAIQPIQPIQPILLQGRIAWTAVWTLAAMVEESVFGHDRDLDTLNKPSVNLIPPHAPPRQ